MSGAKASAPKSNLCSFKLKKKLTFEVTERLELISLQSLRLSDVQVYTKFYHMSKYFIIMYFFLM